MERVFRSGVVPSPDDEAPAGKNPHAGFSGSLPKVNGFVLFGFVRFLCCVTFVGCCFVFVLLGLVLFCFVLLRCVFCVLCCFVMFHFCDFAFLSFVTSCYIEILDQSILSFQVG